MPYKDPEVRRAKSREWREKNRDKVVAYQREYYRNRYDNDPEYRERVKSDARARYCPESAKARYAVRAAVRRGDINKPEQCSLCGRSDNGRIEAAHTDYSKPLDITWMCASCHRYEDAKNPKGGTK